jgi:hypothetical protein
MYSCRWMSPCASAYCKCKGVLEYIILNSSYHVYYRSISRFDTKLRNEFLDFVLRVQSVVAGEKPGHCHCRQTEINRCFNRTANVREKNELYRF